MVLWQHWLQFIGVLRGACNRERTFLWMVVVLIGFMVRSDLGGVTSIIRATGLCAFCYDRVLDLFHSHSLDIERLTAAWTKLVLETAPLLRVNDRLIFVADGVKVPKSGKKMPAVKKLHQESESNTKPSFIFGHSCQAVAVLAGSVSSVFSLPLICRIHEGVKYTNRDKRTLVDKMCSMLRALAVAQPHYLVADAYYAAGHVAISLAAQGNYLLTRVRKNAVAYAQPKPPKRPRRGRPKKYGTKIYLRKLFDDTDAMQKASSPVYGEEKTIIAFRCVDLLWKSSGCLVRYVLVDHPTRGKIILMSTDVTLDPMEIIRLYGLRFKIEVSFKQAIRTVGVFCYHFWMSGMKRLGRKGATQHLHKAPKAYREKVRRKIDAYHRYIQLGLIAQGSLQYLSCKYPELIWQNFGSWLRTIREGVLPSEMVTAAALRNTLADFLASNAEQSKIAQFLLSKIDLTRAEGIRLAA